MNSGLKLRSLREECNLTQSGLAKILGVSAGSISNVESGYRRISKGLAIKLSKHFDNDINYWLEDSENLNLLEKPYNKISNNNYKYICKKCESDRELSNPERMQAIKTIDKLKEDTKQALSEVINGDIFDNEFTFINIGLNKLIDREEITLDNIDNLNDEMKQTLFDLLKLDIKQNLLKRKLQKLSNVMGKLTVDNIDEVTKLLQGGNFNTIKSSNNND